ncbi:MAG TPA: hypothetical protein VG328_14975 [Stellaceae bacterium]|jgi:hypothetical protein|nr:hypothetical protein [Stellaceae bacterium]
MRICLRWIALGAAALALNGCLSATDKEAIGFPAMPGQARYLPANGQQFTVDGLTTAEAACRNQNGNGATPSIIGTPAFDSCMQSQGYRRVQ